MESSRSLLVPSATWETCTVWSYYLRIIVPGRPCQMLVSVFVILSTGFALVIVSNLQVAIHSLLLCARGIERLVFDICNHLNKNLELNSDRSSRRFANSFVVSVLLGIHRNESWSACTLIRDPLYNGLNYKKAHTTVRYFLSALSYACIAIQPFVEILTSSLWIFLILFPSPVEKDLYILHICVGLKTLTSVTYCQCEY